MAERKSFLLRIDAAVLEAAQRWANDELRSVNAQIEFVLREALKRAGRIHQPPGQPQGADPAAASPPETPAGPPDRASGTEPSPSSDPRSG